MILSVNAFLVSLISAAASLSCKSDTGAAVDSWWLFKEPEGTKYVYYDGSGLALSSHSLNDTTAGALAGTLQQAWGDTGYIFYNDEPPGSSNYNFSYGHTKGVWIWDSTSAVIVQHSIPLFPVGPSTVSRYEGLGGNAYRYGQHAACITVDLTTLDEIATAALRNAPQIYDFATPADTHATVRDLAHGTRSDAAECGSVNFTTRGGTEIHYFTKTTEWNNELYGACIAPALQTNLLVESWIHGSAEGPWCGGPYSVYDAQMIDFADAFGFKEANDHSKWATDGAQFACTSDINRMTSQYTRGGGAFCFTDLVLAQLLGTAVQTHNSCI